MKMLFSTLVFVDFLFDLFIDFFVEFFFFAMSCNAHKSPENDDC